ncbi:MAG: DUF937 domain-containing protein [Steroidobacteraceae bacterium]
MQLTDLLGQVGGLQSMARELGVSESQAASGAAALLPAILGGFKKQAQAQPGGLGGLGSLLNGLGGGGLLDDVLSPQPTNVGRGNDVLGQIFGSRDVSRAVAQNAAGQTGLDPALLRKMLPILAMLAAGYMARQHGAGAAGGASGAAVGSGAALPGGLGGLLGGAGGGGAGGLAGALGGMLGGGGSGAPQAPGGSLASMLDLDGDGNPLDDILGMAGKLVR